MKTPKLSRPPPQPRQPPSRASPEQLSFFQVTKLTKAGKRDGHHSLPKQEEDGMWNSPTLSKEANAYDEFCVYAWSDLQEAHEQKFREIGHLCQEIGRLEEQIATQRKLAPPPPDLSARLHGEEMLSEKIVRTRRQREFDKDNAQYYGELKRMENTLDQTCRRLSEILNTVQAAEKTIAMNCGVAAGNALKRLTIYWHGALLTNPYDIPPTPEISLESNAEEEYHEHNRHIKEEAARILSRGNYMPRMEVNHVSKQKKNRM